MLNDLSVDPTSWWGWLVAFSVPLLDGFFPVVPSEAVVVSIGVFGAHSLDAGLGVAVALVALGAFCGDTISYWLGRRFGRRLIKRFLSGQKGVRRMAWAERGLQDHGVRLLILARFVPGGRIAVTMTAGIVGYPYRQFRIATAIAAPIWTMYALGIGLIGGRTFEDSTLAALTLGFAIALVGCVLLEAGRRLWGRARSAANPKEDLDRTLRGQPDCGGMPSLPKAAARDPSATT